MKRRSVKALCCVWAAVFSLSGMAFSQEAARIEPMSIVTESSATLFSAEIADSNELRERGLMFRHLLPIDRAMLFDFENPRPAAMWMKNTYISLDMLFVRSDGTIAAIAENTEPMSTQTISVNEPVQGVVELAAGTVKRLGIKRNDKVYHHVFKTENQ
jgi:uncharacterized membrane protein (UPF0127 family)